MEQVDILNRFREQTGVTKGRKELVKGEYRISTHIWVMDSNGRILVLKRSEQEDKFPGMWAQVGGGVVAGDTSKETVIKECLEELGLTVNALGLSFPSFKNASLTTVNFSQAFFK